MPDIRHILFPFDFSDQGVLAARFVRAMATRYQARVTLLSVLPPVWNVPPAGIPALAPDSDDMLNGLERRLNKALIPELAGLAVEREVDMGDPGLKIAEFAARHAVDLIMMPTHGFGLFRSLLIGSVTAKVLHDAACPVWTATHDEEQRSSEIPSTILCAIDGSDKSCGLLKWAFDFSTKLGARLNALHVVPAISDWLTLPSERSLQEEYREEARIRMDALKKAAGLEVPVRVAVGDITKTVAEEARQEGAELVLIGRGTLQQTLGRLRTHAYGIIRTSPCPVLSV